MLAMDVASGFLGVYPETLLDGIPRLLSKRMLALSNKGRTSQGNLFATSKNLVFWRSFSLFKSFGGAPTAATRLRT